MVGRSPFDRGDDGHGDRDDHDRDGRGGTTAIGAPIVPVNLDLRNVDGTPRFVNGQRLYLGRRRST